MADLELIHDGVSTVIARDGSITSAIVKLCDECARYESVLGGSSTRYFGDEILWICASCRATQ